jgi:hypothetical protein
LETSRTRSANPFARSLLDVPKVRTEHREQPTFNLNPLLLAKQTLRVTAFVSAKNQKLTWALAARDCSSERIELGPFNARLLRRFGSEADLTTCLIMHLF